MGRYLNETKILQIMVMANKETGPQTEVDVDVQLWQDKRKWARSPSSFWVEIARHKLSRRRDKPGAAAAPVRPDCHDDAVPSVFHRQPRKQIVEASWRSRLTRVVSCIPTVGGRSIKCCHFKDILQCPLILSNLGVRSLQTPRNVISIQMTNSSCVRLWPPHIQLSNAVRTQSLAAHIAHSLAVRRSSGSLALRRLTKRPFRKYSLVTWLVSAENRGSSGVKIAQPIAPFRRR